jgi:ABC-2 type transport system permease protein
MPWRIVDVLAGLAIFGVAFHRMGRWPSAGAVAAAAALLACAVLVLYSLWILVISAAFYLVKIDNLSYLFASIYDAARWPVDVFRGFLRLLFTFVIPLALLTSYPALALLGKLDLAVAAQALGGSLLFAVAARLVWTRAIRRYTSASS